MYMQGTRTQIPPDNAENKIGGSALYQNAAAATNPRSLSLLAKKIVVLGRLATAAHTLTLKRYDTSDPAGTSTSFVFSWANTTPLRGPYEINLDLDMPFGGSLQVSDSTNLVVALVYVPIKVNDPFEQPGLVYA